VWVGETFDPMSVVLYVCRGSRLCFRDSVHASPDPNTVLKAYRELEREGLTRARPGQGTFILRSLSSVPSADQQLLQQRFAAWLVEARAAGLDEGGIRAVIEAALQEASGTSGAIA
jgi:DNA-binding transcriptional regulator YhcF (GntR family)